MRLPATLIVITALSAGAGGCAIQPDQQGVPEDFALAVTVVSPWRADDADAPPEERGARYVYQPDRVLRAERLGFEARLLGTARDVYPGRRARLNDAQAAELWRLTEAEGFVEPGAGNVDVAVADYTPPPRALVYVIDVISDGQWRSFVIQEPGDGPKSGRQIVRHLAGWARLY